MPETSSPLLAMSVATRICALPFRNWRRDDSLNLCSMPPCSATAGKLLQLRVSLTSSHFNFVSTKTTVMGSFASGPPTRQAISCSWDIRVMKAATLSCSLVFCRCCTTFAVGLLTAPTFTLTGLFRYSFARLSISSGMVALNSSVWCLSGRLVRISLIWGSKPMSSILSASSRTTKLTRCKLQFLCWRWSRNLPGVATTTSTPCLSICLCSLIGAPPTMMHVLTLLVWEKILHSSAICWASSLVGARTTARGPSPLAKGFWFVQCAIMGIEKDAVLPLPVSAQPRMSLPERAVGMA
mmetsp:Transcript_7460/g.27031  ORF Transcript_7460/g.27031 Transcript_7460/m.27031 type:complete len:296 (-) Transcript_7460:364-1251(-)